MSGFTQRATGGGPAQPQGPVVPGVFLSVALDSTLDDARPSGRGAPPGGALLPVGVATTPRLTGPCGRW